LQIEIGASKENGAFGNGAKYGQATISFFSFRGWYEGRVGFLDFEPHPAECFIVSKRVDAIGENDTYSFLLAYIWPTNFRCLFVSKILTLPIF